MRLSFVFIVFLGILSASRASFASPASLECPPISEAREGETENGANHPIHDPNPDVSSTAHSPPKGRILKIAGWSVFGGAYLGTAILATALLVDGLADAAFLFIPIAGPAVLAGMAFHSDAGNDGGDTDGWGNFIGTFLLIPTVIQTVGAALLTVGHIQAHRSRRMTSLNRFSIAILPIRNGDGGARLGLGMRF